jgi:hypothetical protein
MGKNYLQYISLQASQGGSETCRTDIKKNVHKDLSRKRSRLENVPKQYVRVLSIPKRNASGLSHLGSE